MSAREPCNAWQARTVRLGPCPCLWSHRLSMLLHPIGRDRPSGIRLLSPPQHAALRIDNINMQRESGRQPRRMSPHEAKTVRRMSPHGPARVRRCLGRTCLGFRRARRSSSPFLLALALARRPEPHALVGTPVLRRTLNAAWFSPLTEVTRGRRSGGASRAEFGSVGLGIWPEHLSP